MAKTSEWRGLIWGAAWGRIGVWGRMALAILDRMVSVKLGRLSGQGVRPLPPGGREPMGPSAGKTATVSLLVAGLLVAGLLLSGFGAMAWSKPRGLLPGETITLDKCLKFSVIAMRDRDGVLDHFDWVTVRVENGCAESRRFLVVELMVIDPVGQAYGGKLWVLGRGEQLLPGSAKTEHYAVPDPDNRMPHRWLARLVYVQKPGLRRKAPPPRAVRGLKARGLKARGLKTRRHESRPWFRRVR